LFSEGEAQVFDNIRVVGGPLVLSTAAEVDEAEAQLGIRFLPATGNTSPGSGRAFWAASTSASTRPVASSPA
jgi:hypothetical protein